MTIYFPDIFSGQAGMSFKGTPVAMVKATQGTGYRNPDYASARARAASAGAFFCAYHFLTQGGGAAQADYAFALAGAATPLMLDWETTTGSSPSLADAQAFVTRYRALGGSLVLCYLPHWYWQQLGSPSLAWFAGQGLFLVSSNYQAYSDSGPGWAGYGGMTVAVWQYTSSASFNGYSPVDFNAYKGTAAQFIALVQGVPPRPQDQVLSSGDSGPAVTYCQQRLNIWHAAITADGLFGPATLAAVKTFQSSRRLTADGTVGPLTWAALDRTPAMPDVTLPDLSGQSAGQAHNALIALGLVPSAVAGQEAADPVAGTDPPAGTAVPAGSTVVIIGAVWHGEYVTGGMFSLAQLAAKLGWPVNAMLRMTAVHYGSFGDDLGALLAGILTGTEPWDTACPAGVLLWCD